MPQTLAIGAIVATVASTAASVDAAQTQAQYQAQVANRNATLGRADAANTMQAGAQQEQQQLFKTAGLVSAARAAQGSSGLDVNSGSGVGVRASDAALGNLGAAEIRSNTARQAYGQEVTAQGFSDTANADIIGGDNAAFGDVLSGVGKLGGLAGQLQASGAFADGSAPQISGAAGGGVPAGWGNNGGSVGNYGWSSQY